MIENDIVYMKDLIQNQYFPEAKSLSILWKNNEVNVSWNNIFISPYQLYYEVSAGAVEASINILQWQETTNTNITFGIPSSVGAISGLPIHVTIRSVSVGGFAAVKVGSFKLP